MHIVADLYDDTPMELRFVRRNDLIGANIMRLTVTLEIWGNAFRPGKNRQQP